MVPFYRDALRVSSFLESTGSRRPRSGSRRRTNTQLRAPAPAASNWTLPRQSCGRPGSVFARRNAFEGDQSPQKQSKTDAPSLTGRTEAVKCLWLRSLCASVLVRH